MNDVSDAVNRLNARLTALEQRVHALEHPEILPAAATAPEQIASPAEITGAQEPLEPGFNLFPVLGRAMLGIAGAYVLRAVAESGVLPRLAVGAFGIAYALAWLVVAARMRKEAWLAGAAYACTSALILAPMLWELTLRFKTLPAAAAAAALCVFVATATALTWKHERATVVWVATVTAAAVAVTLAVTSHRMTAFLMVLLFLVALSEYAAKHVHEHSARVIAAVAADLALWAQIYIYSSPQGAHGDYPPVARTALLLPAFTLFLIFAASVTLRSVVLRQAISFFETLQTMLAFVLASCALLSFGPAAGRFLLGIGCLSLAAALYAATFLLFDSLPEQRNYHVFVTWSAGLLLAGSWLCLPLPGWIATLCVAAVAATAAGAWGNRLALEFHGMVYLATAAAAAGLLSYVAGSLAGAMPNPPALRVTLAAACAVLCYALTRSHQGEGWKPQTLHLGFATLAAGAMAALLVRGMTGLVALGVQPGAHHLAFLRTLTLCAAALALAFAGAHWQRIELTRIGYAALALVTLKLFLEDLRHGHLAYIAGSIFLVALTLIAVPRVARARRGPAVPALKPH